MDIYMHGDVIAQIMGCDAMNTFEHKKNTQEVVSSFSYGTMIF